MRKPTKKKRTSQGLEGVRGDVGLLDGRRDRGQLRERALERAPDRAQRRRVADPHHRLLRDAVGVVEERRGEVDYRKLLVRGLAGELLLEKKATERGREREGSGERGVGGVFFFFLKQDPARSRLFICRVANMPPFPATPFLRAFGYFHSLDGEKIRYTSHSCEQGDRKARVAARIAGNGKG